MSSQSHFNRSIQRRVIWTLVIVAAVVLAAGIPLVVNDELRLDLAMRFDLVPGKDAEQISQPNDGSVLVVVPIQGETSTGNSRTFYRAQFIGRPTASGTELTDIDSGATIDIPIREVDFIAADPAGEHLLFRGKNSEPAVVVDARELTASALPNGQRTPNMPGDWETSIWAAGGGQCDRYSPSRKYVACFNRADGASYLAGDWQIDIQVYGDFKATEPVFRGRGFLLPMVGFAQDDTWLYFQGMDGIWRVEVPRDLQEIAR